MFDLAAIQAALREFQLDGWLLCDFRGSNLLARRVLELEDKPVTSRRWYYCIPADGEPRRLVHRIEQSALDHLPGTKTVYLTWQELEAGVARLVADLELVAMEHSPRCANPYVSRVDAGTVELVRTGGVDVVSSGDLVQMFEAVLDDDARRSHFDAAVQTDAAFDRAWRFIAEKVRPGETVHESDVQAEILRHFVEQGMTTSHPPIVAVNAHSGDPHYETGSGRETAVREGDFV
ncbi:MAG: M24 family metallopeptidase, partial [Planctomycetaceae bacterium]